MRLTVPAGLAALALVGPLALWYLLRSRRPRVEVGSTLLWQRTDASTVSAVPWQRFRPDRTFWLVLAAIVAGALALARPGVPTAAELGDHTILMLDASASMMAVEDGPTRLELARRQALEMLEGLSPGQAVSVIEAGPRARILLSAGTDRGAARRAVDSVRPTAATADLADAFVLAEALQRPGQQTVLHLLTDRAVPEAFVSSAPAGLRVTAVGRDRPNLATTRLQVLPTGSGSATVFAQVRNFGVLAATALLDISVDGEVLVSQSVDLAPRGTEDLVFDVALPADAGVVRATVHETDQATERDALAVDDTAAVVLPPAGDLVALVAGPGNVFVEAALAALGGMDVRTAPAVPSDLSGVDLLVVDRVAGPTAPATPTLYLAPSRAADAVEMGSEVAQPSVTFQDSGHDLLRDVDLSGLAIAAARPVAAPALAGIVAGPDGTLVAAGRVNGQPVVHVAFDLLASNLPLDVSWPVFTANAVNWLAGAATSAPLVAGDEWRLSVPAGATGVELQPPSGEVVRLDAVAPRLRLDQVGVWQARWTGPQEVVAQAAAPLPVAVNAAPEESDLVQERPPENPPASAVASADETAPITGIRTFGQPILAIVALLLLVEWVSAHASRPLRFRRKAAG